MKHHTLDIVNACQHNLKGIDLSIPLGKITVLTGPSGSGKSTLALDVLFAEGQHRYLESLGMAVRRVVHLWDRPLVDSIKGIPPPIVLDQKPLVRSPRSTVSTLTGLSDLFRLFFATCARPYCPRCQIEIKALSVDQMADRIMDLSQGTRFTIMAPLSRKIALMPMEEILNNLKKDGFLRVKIDGELFTLDTLLTTDGQAKSLELVVDRLIMKPGILSRLADSLALALAYGDGSVFVEILSADVEKKPEVLSLSERMTCSGCGDTFPAVSPRLFSCSHPDGMCNSCAGTGKYKSGRSCLKCRGTGLNPFARSVLIDQLTFPDLMTWSIHRARSWLLSFASVSSNGLHVLKNLRAGVRIVEAVLSRLKPLEEMGLGYLGLDRPASTLSGGEIQRLRLGAQLGLDLSGILYILDEPTVGLHPREQQALWHNLTRLRDQGNTVILIEHDLNIIQRADHVIELGPGAGDAGGHLVFSGTLDEMMKSQKSITGPYLKGTKCLKRHGKKKKAFGQIALRNAHKNNLKNITVKFPLGCLVCVTGVSGSGKSSLVIDELYNALRSETRNRFSQSERIKTKISLQGGLSTTPETVLVDQTPLVKARFSTPATYMGIFTHIRAVFSRVPEARSRGYKAGYFSLTRKGGRCERCQGRGFLDLDLQYLPSIRIECDLCKGKRYNREALAIKYKGLNIAQTLGMTTIEAADFFARIPRVRRALEVMERIGLGYLKLGQPASTLSGGEAQRLKLARELAKQAHDSMIYIMDEPSRGLHPCDLEKFFSILDEFLDQGHSVILIEHQPEILALADWIIELGPGGGPDGGNIVVQGPPAKK